MQYRLPSIAGHLPAVRQRDRETTEQARQVAILSFEARPTANIVRHPGFCRLQSASPLLYIGFLGDSAEHGHPSYLVLTPTHASRFLANLRVSQFSGALA